MKVKYRIYYQNKYYIGKKCWDRAEKINKDVIVYNDVESAWIACMVLEKKYPMYNFGYDVEC